MKSSSSSSGATPSSCKRATNGFDRILLSRKKVPARLIDINVIGDYQKMLSPLTDPKFGLFAKGPLSQLHFRFLRNTNTKEVEVTYMMYGLPEGAVVPIIFKDQNSDFYKLQPSFNVKDSEREECQTFTSDDSVVAPSFASVIYDQVRNITDACSSDCSDKESVSVDEESVSNKVLVS